MDTKSFSFFFLVSFLNSPTVIPNPDSCSFIEVDVRLPHLGDLVLGNSGLVVDGSLVERDVDTIALRGKHKSTSIKTLSQHCGFIS